MNFFEKELRGMFQRRESIKEPVFSGKAVVGKLDSELRLRLEFVTSGVMDEYTGIEAKIIHRTNGMVDMQVFRFADIVGMKPGRIERFCEPQIWVDLDKKVSWYTPMSDAEKQKIANTVMEYVDLYQAPEPGLRMNL